jgi:hypothetical protein
MLEHVKDPPGTKRVTYQKSQYSYQASADDETVMKIGRNFETQAKSRPADAALAFQLARVATDR